MRHYEPILLDDMNGLEDGWGVVNTNYLLRTKSAYGEEQRVLRLERTRLSNHHAEILAEALHQEEVARRGKILDRNS
jgi:hypothetical protein